MASPATITMEKMLESLPERVQEQVVEHLREYLAHLKDELEWDDLFNKTQHQLSAAARHARQEMAQEHAKPMDYNKL